MQRFVSTTFVLALLATTSRPAAANDLWVAPTSQQDLGGLGVASNTFWPVTPVGAVRLAFAVPGDLQAFQGARLSLIPGSSSAGAVLTYYLCPASANKLVSSACAGPFEQKFASVANQLTEVDVSAGVAGHLGEPGASYVALLAYTSPAIATDHILGLRFTYAPKALADVPTLGANTFTGTQAAPLFVGDGSKLTNLPPGPPGPPGGPGAPGAQGPAGPSDAFTTFGGNTPLSANQAAVALLTLGPGSYVFIASARVYETTVTPTIVECYIGGIASPSVNVNLNGMLDRTIVSLNYAVTLTAASTVMPLYCEIKGTASGAAAADEVFFTAIKVQTITRQ